MASYRELGFPYPELVMEQSGQDDRTPKAPGRYLGTVVRGARTAQGVTLAELGRRTGYSAAQVPGTSEAWRR